MIKQLLTSMMLVIATGAGALFPTNASAQCAQAGVGAALQQGECAFLGAGFGRVIEGSQRSADIYSSNIGIQKGIDENLFLSVTGSVSHAEIRNRLLGINQDAQSYALAATVRYLHDDYLFSAGVSGFFADDELILGTSLAE